MTGESPLPPSVPPPPHEGKHYDNPSSKTLTGPPPLNERDGVQRLVWRLLFGLVFAVMLTAVVLSLVNGRP